MFYFITERIIWGFFLKEKGIILQILLSCQEVLWYNDNTYK